MNAVILAAGRGSRLAELTGDMPKCMVQVGGRAIIDHQLDSLLAAGVQRITIVAGYRADQLMRHVCDVFGADSRIEFVINEVYETTNNMYSLYLVQEEAGGDELLLMNADVVFDASIIDEMSRLGGNAVAVDVGAFRHESMKVSTHDGAPGLCRISKELTESESLGCSIDVYRFDKDGVTTLLDRVRETVEGRGRRNDWTELALDELMNEGALRVAPFDIRGRHWFEIDNMDDLREAQAALGSGGVPWDRLKIAFLDMDGTLYMGGKPIAGAAEFLYELRQRVQHVYFLTDNSSRSREQYYERLRGMGFEAELGDILLSTDALCAYLKKEKISRVFCLGTAAFVDALAQRGIANSADDPQAVVLGYDTELTYQKLRRACLLLHDERVRYVASHGDYVCPSDEGDLPDAGSMMAMIDVATGRRPEAVLGKPDVGMVTHVLEKHGVRPEESVMFGDRHYTDYELAHNLGGFFVGVLTGDSSREDFERCDNAAIFPSVGDVFPSEP